MNCTFAVDDKLFSLRIDWNKREELRKAGLPLEGIEEHLQELEMCGPLLYEAIYICLEDRNAIKKQDFFNLLCDGSVIEGAKQAFWQAVFFTFPKGRSEVLTAARKEVESQIQKVISGEAFTESQASLESNRAPIVSES